MHVSHKVYGGTSLDGVLERVSVNINSEHVGTACLLTMQSDAGTQGGWRGLMPRSTRSCLVVPEPQHKDAANCLVGT